MSQHPPVLFPDAVAVVIALLRDGLSDYGHAATPVVSVVPAERPELFVLVRRTGGPRSTLVTDQPTLTIEAWATEPEDAQDLGQLARMVLTSATGTVVDGTTVGRVDEVGGLAFFPDPTSDQSRYTQTLAIALRGTHPTGS